MKAPIFKYLSGFVIHFKYTLQKEIVTVASQLSGSNVEKLLALIAGDENITIAQLAANIAVTDRTIKRILKELQDDNKLVRTGSNKSGTWKIID